MMVSINVILFFPFFASINALMVLLFDNVRSDLLLLFNLKIGFESTSPSIMNLFLTVIFMSFMSELVVAVVV